MGLVDFVEALEVVLVRLGEGNNQQGCSDAHLGTGLLELAARYLGCNKSKGNPHIGFLGKLGILSQPRGIQIFHLFFPKLNVMKHKEKNVLRTFGCGGGESTKTHVFFKTPI